MTEPMDEGLNLYWGDMHTNVHHHHMPSLEDTFAAALAHLDFFPIAYYPFYYYQAAGKLQVETVGQRDQFLEDWEEVLRQVERHNDPGRFVTFAGYEWHGDRRFYGDHNVFYFGRGPLTAAQSLPHLYAHLRRARGIAIPHHTAYQVGERGKDWHYHEDDLSPFAEIYSSHGSSEGCNTPFTLERNQDMAPRVSGGSIQDGLAHGYRIGIMASSDSHNGYPGPWGSGLMGVYAAELSRPALWEAFLQRRVFGVTGDRMALAFRLNGHFMGSDIRAHPPMEITGTVVGSDAIDRIELLRDNRVVHTLCHADRWEVPQGGGPHRLKLRLQCGWGLSPRYGVRAEPRTWRGVTEVDRGRIISCEGLFTDFGQSFTQEGERSVSWQLTTPPRESGRSNVQGMVFEIEAPLSAHVRIQVGDEDWGFHVSEAFHRSRVVTFQHQTREEVQTLLGVGQLSEVENLGDVLWHNSAKMKAHLAVPEAAYRVPFTFVDEEVPPGRHWYYLRVAQLNGQMAWSSPVWVEVPEDRG
ncbi:MAG: DUF3604 domain-containing protein [Anaerolineae bacterium]|nr:DUF3604 domain-containing protein [Anaerolineae bacterium]